MALKRNLHAIGKGRRMHSPSSRKKEEDEEGDEEDEAGEVGMRGAVEGTKGEGTRRNIEDRAGRKKSADD